MPKQHEFNEQLYFEHSESAIESMQDRCESLQVCFVAFNAPDVHDFCSQIEALFSDDQKGITLSTVHRAKGLEENRVFILRPEKLPLVWSNQEAWQHEQEMNLLYVAITRAKQALYFVREDVASVQQALPLEALPVAETQEAAAIQPTYIERMTKRHLNVTANDLEKLINEAAEIINARGVKVPQDSISCLVDLRGGLEKLRMIADHNE